MDTSIYKTDTSVKRTPKKRSLPFFAPSIWLSLLTFYKTDISLRRTASAGPKGVRLRESWLHPMRKYNGYIVIPPTTTPQPPDQAWLVYSKPSLFCYVFFSLIQKPSRLDTN